MGFRIFLILLFFINPLSANIYLALKSQVQEISREHQKFADILKKEYGLKVQSIKELTGGSCSQKPLLITTFENKKYVFKFLTYNKKDLLFFLNFNLHLQNNGINIHKIHPTKTNQYFAEYSKQTLYALFEYFEDFEMKPFDDYFKVGNMLARMDNIMLNFQYPNPRKYKSRIQVMQEVLQKTFDTNQMLDIVKIIQFLEIHKKRFLKLAIHNDLHSENVDTQFRVIDVGIAQYDWRINNFINIFFNRGDRKFTNLEVLQAIIGYNAIAIKPLNFHEMLGVLYVIKSRVYEDLILRNSTFLRGMDLEVIERFHYSALALKTQVKYLTKEMMPDERQFDIEDKVKYYSKIDRIKYLVIVKNKIFYDIWGNILDTTDRKFVFNNLTYFLNSVKFVIDAFGNIFLHNARDLTSQKHSQFLAGEPVAFAGMIEIYKGTLISFDADSGHYQPNNFYALQAIDCFVNLGCSFFQVIHYASFLNKSILYIVIERIALRYGYKKKVNQFKIFEIQKIYHAS